MQISVIDRGFGWLVVDKPANLTVHNEPGNDVLSKVRECLIMDTDLAQKTGFNKASVIGPVHRLDRETSGVLMLGLTADVCRKMTKQFEHRDVIKKYIALVHGAFDIDDDHFEWTYPLSDGSAGRDNPKGKGKTRWCETKVRIMEKSPHYTMIDCQLITGRKHQIRRHAKLGGHPVLGDHRYGSKRAVNYLAKHASFDRLALHSTSLTLKVPEGGQRTFHSQAPKEFITLLENDSHT